MSEMIEVQKMANQSAKEIQKMVDKANKVTLKFNAQEAKKQREFNKQEASTARAWEKEMSDTSHQREVKDLQKVGLNPVLSVNDGANSYTTAAASASNASGSAESGASAMSNIFGTMMQNMVGLQQSKMQIEANLRAAQIQASATKYAADRQAEASRYVADKQYESVMDKPVSTAAALVDKYATKAGFGDDAKGIVEGIKDVIKHPRKYFYNEGNISTDKIATTRLGWNMASKFLYKKNIPVNTNTVKHYWKAMLFGNSASITFLYKYNQQYRGHGR